MAADAEDLFASIEADAVAATAAAPASSSPTKKRKALAQVQRPDEAAEVREQARASKLAVGDIIAGDGKGLPDSRLGSVVFWSADDIAVVPWNLYDAIVEVDRSRDTVDRDDGIDFDFVGPAFADLVPTPSPVAQAARRAMSRRQKGLPIGCRWQDVGDDKGLTVIALTEAEADAAQRDWTASARWFVAFKHDDGSVVLPDAILDDDEQAALDGLLDRYAKERSNLTAQDIGRILVTAILERLRGFRVKAGGGVYFVPRPLDAHVDRLASAFALAGVFLRRVPVLGGDGAQFKGAAEDSLVEDATRILEEARAATKKLADASEQSDKKHRPRPDAIYRRLKDIEEIQARATAYAGLLGVLRVNVDDALKEAKEASAKTLALLAPTM